jgi:hypothetical protein
MAPSLMTYAGCQSHIEELPRRVASEIEYRTQGRGQVFDNFSDTRRPEPHPSEYVRSVVDVGSGG